MVLTKHNSLINKDSSNGIHLIRNNVRADPKHIITMKKHDTALMASSKHEGQSSAISINFTKILWMTRKSKTKVIEMRGSSLRILRDILNQNMISKNNMMLLILMIQTTLNFERSLHEICLLDGVYLPYLCSLWWILEGNVIKWTITYSNSRVTIKCLQSFMNNNRWPDEFRIRNNSSILKDLPWWHK